MTCYHPITMYRVRSGKNPVTGAWPLTTSPKLGYTDKPIQVPCGQCIGCRLEYARQWTDRCEKELMHPHLPLIQDGKKVRQLEYRQESCFLTLTYDNEHLPDDKGLNKSDLQKPIPSYVFVILIVLSMATNWVALTIMQLCLVILLME